METKVIHSLIINGDLASLSQEQKIQYYKSVCERVGLDFTAKPFEIIRLQGREVLYLTRSGAQQLNQLHSVSHTITGRELIDEAGVYQVTARASTPDGRYTDSIGAVSISGLKGDAYANAIMKAETKAKRRSTLDLLGLGLLDETEVETIKQDNVLLDKERLYTLLDNSTYDERYRGMLRQRIDAIVDQEKYNLALNDLLSNQLDPVTHGKAYSQGDIKKHIKKLS
jgi:hypothetical protein